MISAPDELDRVQREILRTIADRRRPSAPSEVIRTLKQRGLAEDTIRAATWALIDQNLVTLTDDWKLLAREGKRARGGAVASP